MAHKVFVMWITIAGSILLTLLLSAWSLTLIYLQPPNPIYTYNDTEIEDGFCSNTSCNNYIEIQLPNVQEIPDDMCHGGCNSAIIMNINPNVSSVGDGLCESGCEQLQSLELQNVDSIGNNFCGNWACESFSALYINMLNITREVIIGDNFCGNNSCKPVRGMGLYGVHTVGHNFCGHRGCTMLDVLAIPDLKHYGDNFCDGTGGFGCSSMESLIIGPGTGTNVIQYFAHWKRDLLVWCRDQTSFDRCKAIEDLGGTTLSCILSVLT